MIAASGMQGAVNLSTYPALYQSSWLNRYRNRKGTSIHKRIMTVLATWAQQGLG